MWEVTIADSGGALSSSFVGEFLQAHSFTVDYRLEIVLSCPGFSIICRILPGRKHETTIHIIQGIPCLENQSIFPGKLMLVLGGKRSLLIFYWLIAEISFYRVASVRENQVFFTSWKLGNLMLFCQPESSEFHFLQSLLSSICRDNLCVRLLQYKPPQKWEKKKIKSWSSASMR